MTLGQCDSEARLPDTSFKSLAWDKCVGGEGRQWRGVLCNGLINNGNEVGAWFDAKLKKCREQRLSKTETQNVLFRVRYQS